MFGNHFRSFVGPQDSSKDEVLPVGLCRVSCMDIIGIGFVNADGEVQSMFSLNPGKEHIVNVPSDVQVVVECSPKVKWFVKWSNRFNKSDPTRIEAALLRPRSDREEMQDYFNELTARALGGELASQLRSGVAEFDHTNDDYSEDHEDDCVTPFSTYQLGLIIDQLQADLKHQVKTPPPASSQLDIVDEIEKSNSVLDDKGKVVVKP